MERVIESVTYEVAGRGNCVQQHPNLQNVTSVDDFLNDAATETVPLFEHLEFEFLLEYDVFATARRGEHGTMSHQNSSETSCTASTKYLQYSTCYP